MIQAIIFDLDDTLFSSSSIAVKCRKNAVKAMMKHGLKGKFKEIYENLDQIIKSKGSNYNHHFDDLIKNYKIKHPHKTIAAGVIAYHKSKLEGIEVFDGVYNTLKKLNKMRIKLFIMTNGRINKQWEKILLLKLDEYFQDIIISDRANQNLSKIDSFKEIIKKHKLNPKKIISVGDRLRTEIKAGNDLGMTTIRILKGKYKNIKLKEIQPHYTIKEFTELLPVLQKVNKTL